MSNLIRIQSIRLNIQFHLHLLLNATRIHTHSRKGRGTRLTIVIKAFMPISQ